MLLVVLLFKVFQRSGSVDSILDRGWVQRIIHRVCNFCAQFSVRLRRMVLLFHEKPTVSSTLDVIRPRGADWRAVFRVFDGKRLNDSSFAFRFGGRGVYSGICILTFVVACIVLVRVASTLLFAAKHRAAGFCSTGVCFGSVVSDFRDFDCARLFLRCHRYRGGHWIMIRWVRDVSHVAVHWICSLLGRVVHIPVTIYSVR